MKYSTKYFALFFAIGFFVSCENYIGGDINTDPNNPIAVPVSAQIPAIEIALADVYGGQFSRTNCMLVQQVEGTARQCLSANRYGGTPASYNTVWENIYENVLNEIQIAKTKSVENNYYHYEGILNVLEAYTLMISTDVWDDMPYSEALKGLENLNPVYDSQASIYEASFRLLEDGIILLEGASGALPPSGDDVFNNGNIDHWIKAAYGIKARGLLHQKDYQGAMEAAQLSFISADENLAFQYPDANAAANWYRFNRDRRGDIGFHPAMRNLMIELNDSVRLSILDQPFNTDHPYIIADFKEELITYREIQFIIAEADHRINPGGTQVGYDALHNGILASFERLGLTADDYYSYVAQPDLIPTVGNLDLETIMTQKYIAMFLQAESYSDYRRTGIPVLYPVSGTVIPVRWHYSADEYQFNENAPEEGAINIFTDKVGWNR